MSKITHPFPVFSFTTSSELEVVDALVEGGLALVTAGLGPFSKTFAARVVSKARERQIEVQIEEPSLWLIRQIVKTGTDFVVLRTAQCAMTLRQAENYLVGAYRLKSRIRACPGLGLRGIT